jgi:hypothetical protein
MRELLKRLEESDHSKHSVVVQYAVIEMQKKKSPKTASEITAKKLSGASNLFIGSGMDIVSIDPVTLENHLYEIMVQNIIDNISRYKPEVAYDYSLLGTLGLYRQDKKVGKKLKKMVIDKVGKDLFSSTFDEKLSKWVPM